MRPRVVTMTAPEMRAALFLRTPPSQALHPEPVKEDQVSTNDERLCTPHHGRRLKIAFKGSGYPSSG